MQTSGSQSSLGKSRSLHTSSTRTMWSSLTKETYMARQLPRLGTPPPGSIAALTVAGDPRSQHQAEAMVGSNVGLMHPGSLPKMRVTGLQVFEKCPYTWAAKYLDPLAEEEE